MNCAYCERPLICDACQAEFQPADAEQYQAVSDREVAVACPGCGQTLVCHWCKAPYDGRTEETGSD